MANQARLMILCELLGGERTVTELHLAVGLAMSAMSQHLAKLREEGIVATRRKVSNDLLFARERAGGKNAGGAVRDILRPR